MRSVKEWIGKTDDHMPPATVRTRIFVREGGICHICGLKIDPGQKWIPDHCPPLADGGENRESKIKPAHKRCHEILTGKQNSERAPLKAKQQKHIGATPAPYQPIQSQPFRQRTRARPKMGIDKGALTALRRKELFR